MSYTKLALIAQDVIDVLYRIEYEFPARLSDEQMLKAGIAVVNAVKNASHTLPTTFEVEIRFIIARDNINLYEVRQILENARTIRRGISLNMANTFFNHVFNISMYCME